MSDDKITNLDSRRPHLSGDCVCSSCGHEWPCVIQVGLANVECPKCSTMFGALKHPIEPARYYTCGCGNNRFWWTPKGALCQKCGRFVDGD